MVWQYDAAVEFRSRAVLICAAETSTSYAMISSLRRHWGRDVRIVSADDRPAQQVTASLLSDCHIVTPSGHSADFGPCLADLLISQNISDYIPLHDFEILALGGLPRIGKGVSVWTCGRAPELTGDKNLAFDLLDGIGVPTPRRFGLADLPTEGRVFAKPRRGYGGRGGQFVSVESLCGRSAEELSRMILQEACLPPEVTVDCFHDAATGRHRSLVRERLATRSGVCVTARVYEDPLLSRYACQIGQALNLRGTLCFQAMRGSEGWLVTDLNLRPGAGTTMLSAVGVDLLGAMAACRWNEPVEPLISATLPPTGVHVTRQYQNYVMS